MLLERTSTCHLSPFFDKIISLNNYFSITENTSGFLGNEFKFKVTVTAYGQMTPETPSDCSAF